MASSPSFRDWFLGICGEEFDLGSSCAQRSLIDAFNLAFLLASAVGFLISSFRNGEFRERRRRRRRWDSAIASVLCSVIGILCFCASFWILLDGRRRRRSTFEWNWLVYFQRGIIWISLAFSLQIHAPKQWLKTLVLIWWMTFSLLISAFDLEMLIRGSGIQTLDLISWPVSLLLLFLALKLAMKASSKEKHFHGDHSLLIPLQLNQNEGRTSLSKAGFFSRLTFSWMNPLLRLGSSKPLVLEDIPLLHSDDGAFVAFQTFSRAWELERKNGGRRTRNSVLISLAKCYKKEMLLVGFYALLKSLCVAASPLILYAFILFSRNKEKDFNSGFILITSLIILKFADSFSQRHWYFDSRRFGMRMRSAVMAAVYQKQLRLSSRGRRRHSAGEIVNYIAVDAYRLGEFPWWFHMAWSLPLQILLCVLILIMTVGSGALPGLLPLIIFGFLNVPVAKILQYYQSQFMVAQDERLRATSEALGCMKIIKLQSWEEHFRKMVESLRAVEFKWLKDIQMTRAHGSALYWMAPTVVSAVIFAGTAALKTAQLDAGTIFTVLATLRAMSEPVRVLPEALSVLIQVMVSLDRIGAFQLEDEIDEESVERIGSADSDLSILLSDGFFSWEVEEAGIPALKNINLAIRKGRKVAVCGPVGAGKSSLIQAMLGEMPKISGSVRVLGTVAYVSQTSWIQSGTVRDNILYGKAMDWERYEMAVRYCALDKDIENFAHGDRTEIGQRGLNMSGGQKQRIQLARAVYADADVYLLDDPFSAVDAHTAAILFHDCVMTALENKTVILVTHQVEFLAEADVILVMEEGQITQTGTYEELLESGTAFEKLVIAHTSSLTSLNSSAQRREPGEALLSTNSETDISINESISAAQLTEDEEKEIGNAGLKPYRDYLQVPKGFLLSSSVVFTHITFVALQTLSTYWMAFAIQMYQVSSTLLVGVYAVISILSCLFAHIRSLLAAELGLRASSSFHAALMDSLFRAPMSFFDSTPLGRILTRAASDLYILDFDIPSSLLFFLAGLVDLLLIIVIVSAVTWKVLLVALPVLMLVAYLQRYYLTSARELVRINGTTKAPVMNYATESYLGAVTIRAFGMAERFFGTNLKLIDTDAALFFHTNAAMEWLLIRVELLQNLTAIASSIFLVLIPRGSISPELSGLSLSYALGLSTVQVFLTRYYSYVENYIVSVERIKQFSSIPPEPPAVIKESRPPDSWPQQGRIVLENLKIRYRPAAPFVLKGISCSFSAGNKIGVVGRTGSGKTTLISALFRLVDPAEGRILIDGVDICSVGLRDLRMKLSIIPQDPTLFRGSVRTNLDPLGLCTDHEIWEALERCQLKSTIRSLPAQLDSSVSDDGENWSAGQRQLFCLGRVLLRKNRILVMDEATASIDSATDAVLQRIIRHEFSSCTVITIAHRVPTVADSDMVMVLSYGKLLEYEKPSKLMESCSSAFSKLVTEYWANYRKDSSHAF